MSILEELKWRATLWWRAFCRGEHGIGFDSVSPCCMLFLIAIGVTTILSAQSYRSGTQWKMQIVWAAIGMLTYFVISFTDYRLLLRHAHWIYGFGILALLLVFSPLGMRKFGATRWLNVCGVVIQPSEIAKLGTLIMGAGILARTKIGDLKESLSSIAYFCLIFLIPVGLIMLQPDLGSSLPFFPIAFALLFVSGVPGKFFTTIFFLLLTLIGFVAWDAYAYHLYLDENHLSPQNAMGQFEKISFLPLKDYQRNRIISFVAPDIVDPKGIGVSWNLRQSLIAVGTGGLRGKGHQKGTQARLGYLPQSVATNDFVFSVFAEEHGFLGGILVLLLYLILLGNGLRIASMSRDRFGSLLAIGISVMLLVHIGVNIGMTLGIMPITGIPLPFFSYGGSFMMVCCVLQGIVQSIYRFRSKYS
ncbi:MAG: rod shape-determining protein RodA [Verrucomicrobiota bacterium]|nr:MAG: rod shape-determining protein RodA [Verrucomicrobiota bacterium]